MLKFCLHRIPELYRCHVLIVMLSLPLCFNVPKSLSSFRCKQIVMSFIGLDIAVQKVISIGPVTFDDFTTVCVCTVAYLVTPVVLQADTDVFKRILPLSSGLEMWVTYSSRTSVSAYEIARCHKPEGLREEGVFFFCSF
jgi:hypothetical protein